MTVLGNENSVPLDKLAIGRRACVTTIQGDDAVVRRLLEMGLFEGEELEVVGFAPLGDPMEIRLQDYRLSLRRQEAAHILVRPSIRQPKT